MRFKEWLFNIVVFLMGVAMIEGGHQAITTQKVEGPHIVTLYGDDAIHTGYGSYVLGGVFIACAVGKTIWELRKR